MRLGTALILLLLASSIHASESRLFADDSVIAVSLAGPINSLLRSKDDEELAFSLQVDANFYPVKVRTRGKSRKVVCRFPPLRINFSSDDTVNSIFDGLDKLKLVTHCQHGRSNQHNLLQEYAAYRIFNVLTDHSYKVRLLRILYIDTDDRSGKSEFESYSFVIEPASELAARLGATPVDVTGVSLRSLDDAHAAIVYIFQYLIGNTDWSLVRADEDDACCHNGDVFDMGSARYYVPYDFDRSGLVNARYARPDPNLRISKVTQRLYRGFCMAPDTLREGLQSVKSRRTDILEVIRQLPDMSQKDRKSMTSYVERFFALAENEEKLLSSFERRCL